MFAIQTSAVNKQFRRVRAVRDVSLQVEEGAVYALMGPNGAGKTTLIKLLMNLMSPTDGKISVLGLGASHLEGRRLESIGYVSENQKLPNWMTVGRFLAYCRPFYPTWDIALEQHLVKRFDLPLKRRLKHLSRGERMKAALISALAFRPRLIVLDEPLSGLDPLVRDDLIESLRERAAESTVLLSSHDLAEIESYSSHIGYMDQGRLLISEPLSSVRSRFRSVAVTGSAPLSIPAAPPAEWLHFTSNGATARWIETAWDPERSAAKAREVFGTVEVSADPIPLREVFLTMARSGRPSSPASQS
ncbi:MAG: ABC transporter ATP-binding protein [Terracidiphilus sp.]|jgi:ABC-2 type transport system ATP-binding protein